VHILIVDGIPMTGTHERGRDHIIKQEAKEVRDPAYFFYNNSITRNNQESHEDYMLPSEAVPVMTSKPHFLKVPPLPNITLGTKLPTLELLGTNHIRS
jgi:hypothetical protein